MEILSNIILASVILSVMILIIIYYLFNEYEIETKEYTRLFLYMLSIISIFMTYFKKELIKKHGYKPINAAAEVFNEIKDSQHLNGIMPLQSIMGGEEELIIDNIPKSITCNNIVQ